MKAAVLYEQNMPLKVEDLDVADPREGEVRVKLKGAGVCHSDYHLMDGHRTQKMVPFVMGHEGSGVVQEVGAGVRNVSPGDHIIFSLRGQCGYCRNCTAGRPNLCETYEPRSNMPDDSSRFSKNGIPYYHRLATFCEQTIAMADSVVKIREDIPLEKACLVGCGVMTGVGAVLNRAKVEAGSAVVVFGCGGVGLNVVQGAVLASASKIIAIDRVDFKLNKAEEMGATHVVNSGKEDPVKRVIELTGGGADYAFEVVGFPEVLRQAFESIRPGGTAVMVGVPPDGADVKVLGSELFLERTVMGTFYGAGRPRIDFPWLLELYLDGRLKLDELATRYRPLDEVNEGFDDMTKGVALRTILTFE